MIKYVCYFEMCVPVLEPAVLKGYREGEITKADLPTAILKNSPAFVADYHVRGGQGTIGPHMLLLRAESQGGPAAFNQGFWLDENLQYKPASMDVRYWVPPSRILYIEKVTA